MAIGLGVGVPFRSGFGRMSPADQEDLIQWLISDTPGPVVNDTDANDKLDVLGPAKWVGVPILEFTGSETLTVPGLVGTETITMLGGSTAVPTPSAGSIAFTAGTFYGLEIDGVKTYLGCESDGTTVYDITGNDNHATLSTDTVRALSTDTGAIPHLQGGGHTPRGLGADVFEIKHGAGTVDFSWDGPVGTFLWYFLDGTTSTSQHPTTTQAAGSSYLINYVTWAGNYMLNDNTTNANYIGVTTDFPRELTYHLYCYRAGVTGPPSGLPQGLTSRLYCSETGIAGPVSGFPQGLTEQLYCYNTAVTGPPSGFPQGLMGQLYCFNTGIAGDVSGFPQGLTSRLYCHSTSVYGAFTQAQAVCGEIQCYSTSMTAADIGQSLINFDASGETGNTFRCDTGMPTITDPAALSAKTSLEGKGWTVLVNV